jgi:hypothetical protein
MWKHHKGENEMSQYVLLLYQDNSGMASLGPDEMQQAVQKYIDWREKSVLSQRLDNDPGRVIRSKGGTPKASDGPYSETKEMLGGFYAIEASSYDEAVKIAMTNPHLEYGGTIEVRKIFGS